MTDREHLILFQHLQLAQEKRFQPRIYAILRRQVRDVLRYARQNGMDKAYMNIELIIQPDAMFEELAYLYRSVGVIAANEQYAIFQSWEEEQQKAFGFNIQWSRLLDGVFRLFGAAKVTSITEKTRQWIRQILQEGAADGWDYYELSQALRSSKIPLWRSRLIARTETVGATNLGQMTAARSSKILMEKVWLNSHDARVRETHRDGPGGVGGEAVPLEQPFSNGLMQPGDPTPGTPAKEVCNCRCVVAFRPKRDERGRLIRVTA